MINNRLLNEFKSTTDSTVIITDIACTHDSCGQEVLSISTKKIRTPYEEVIKYYDTINKTLEVEGQLELNDAKEYYTNLVGFISNESTNEVDESILIDGDILNDAYRSPVSHCIEEIKTPLEKEISITFNEVYRNQPHIVITIDKEYEDLYRSYSTDFIKNDFNEYIGVKITFKNLKSKSLYPEIGICIIGDQKESYYDGIVKTEAETYIHIYKKQEIVDIHIFEMIEMEQADVKNTTIIITNERGESVSYTTDNCGKIKSILKYGKYNIEIDDENYDNTPISIEVTNSKTSFDIEATPKINITETTEEEETNTTSETTTETTEGE